MIGELENGAELCMGNRFTGGIKKGAMPALHRYFGNPVLSTIARWLHRSPVGDFHCGLRGFTREAFRRIGARSPGMEFASEMVINAHRAGLDIREVPITLHPDNRDRAPHLRSFRDGWRHLRLIIAHAPNTLYLIPAWFSSSQARSDLPCSPWALFGSADTISESTSSRYPRWLR